LFGEDIIKEAEKQVQIIWENLRIAQSRQKSYADGKRRDVVFQEGDYVYLKVSPIRGLRRFKVKGKLSPRFIGPFKILERVGSGLQVGVASSVNRCARCVPYLSAEKGI
jgi:hypothetical protein